MTKIKNYLIITFTIILLFGCDVSDPKAKLEFSLEIGKTYSILIARQVKNYEKFNNELISTNQKIVAGYSFTPTERNSNGLTQLTGQILSIEIDEECPLGRIEYNSVKDTSHIPILAKPYAQLIGKNFEMEVLKDGTVKSVKGLNSALENIFNNYAISEISIKQQLKELLEDQFSDDVLLENFERMLAFYPLTSISIGNKWEKTVALTNEIPFLVHHKYELKERNNGVSVIYVTSEINSDTVRIKKQPQKYPYQILSGTQNGKIQVDEISGWITKAVFQYQLNEDPKAKTSSKNTSRIIASEIDIQYSPLSSGTFKDIVFTPNSILKGDGLGMTIIGMGVVYVSLVILYLLFANISKILNYDFKKKKTLTEETDKQPAPKPEILTGEISAAIAAALHLYSKDIHDEENTVLTIKKVSRTYSPWSSKIYGLRQNPK